MTYRGSNKSQHGHRDLRFVWVFWGGRYEPVAILGSEGGRAGEECQAHDGRKARGAVWRVPIDVLRLTCVLQIVMSWSPEQQGEQSGSYLVLECIYVGKPVE